MNLRRRRNTEGFDTLRVFELQSSLTSSYICSPPSSSDLHVCDRIAYVTVDGSAIQQNLPVDVSRKRGMAKSCRYP